MLIICKLPVFFFFKMGWFGSNRLKITRNPDLYIWAHDLPDMIFPFHPLYETAPLPCMRK